MLTALGRTNSYWSFGSIWIGTLVPAMALGMHRDGMGAAYAHVAVIAPIVLPSYLLALKHVTGVRVLGLGRAALPALLAASAAALGPGPQLPGSLRRSCSSRPGWRLAG